MCQFARAKWQSYMSAYRCPQAHLRDPHATFASCVLCSQPSVSSGYGKPYSGANKYVMHFPKGQTPPADGFWSITMYNADYFFVDNKLNKYTVSPRNDLKYNEDGSLDLYIQNESPGKDKEANWLPAPKDKFILMLRLYWPKEKDPSILTETWKIPPVKKA